MSFSSLSNAPSVSLVEASGFFYSEEHTALFRQLSWLRASAGVSHCWHLVVLPQPGLPMHQPGLPMHQPGLPMHQPGLPMHQPCLPMLLSFYHKFQGLNFWMTIQCQLAFLQRYAARHLDGLCGLDLRLHDSPQKMQCNLKSNEDTSEWHSLFRAGGSLKP